MRWTGFAQPGYVTLAGNEAESIQLVLGAAKRRIDDIYVYVDYGFHDFKARSGHTIESAQISYRLVHDTSHVLDPSKPASPDWLKSIEPFTREPGKVQRLCITIQTRSGQPVGLYGGRIHLRAGDPDVGSQRLVCTVPMNVKVWGFPLPTRMHMKTILGWGVDRDLLLNHHFSPAGDGVGAVTEPRYLMDDEGRMPSISANTTRRSSIVAAGA